MSKKGSPGRGWTGASACPPGIGRGRDGHAGIGTAASRKSSLAIRIFWRLLRTKSACYNLGAWRGGFVLTALILRQTF